MPRRPSLPVRAPLPAFALGALLLILTVGTPLAHAQNAAEVAAVGAACPQGAKQAHHHHPGAAVEVPVNRLSELGQGAFAALSEVVRVLEADSSLDWSRVRVDRLREHLIDMDLVATEADVEVTDLEDGFRARITAGDPRTAAAIHRMVPAHGRMMDGHRGWGITVEPSGSDNASGLVLTVRAQQPSEVIRVQALGFAGFLASGDHHRPHHWRMVTTGEH